MQGKKRDSIYINAAYLDELISGNDWNKAELCRELGYSVSYLNYCLTSGRMDVTAARYACVLLNGNYENLTKRPAPKKKTAPKKNATMDVTKAIVRATDIKEEGDAMDAAELIVSYIQDVGKINSDIVREIRGLREQENEEFLKVSATLTETLSLLRSMATDNRNIHTTINNKLVEMNNRMTSGK